MSTTRKPDDRGVDRPDAEALCTYARRMVTDGLAEGTSGNLSVRNGDLVAVTPSAVEPEHLRPEDICSVRLDGTQVSGPGRPSSELPMHLAIYRRTDAMAVVHTHSLRATAVSTVAAELPPIHYLLVFLGEAVRVAPYATPGSAELGDRVVEALADSSAVILQNHGAVTVGPSLERAYWYAGGHPRMGRRAVVTRQASRRAPAPERRRDGPGHRGPAGLRGPRLDTDIGSQPSTRLRTADGPGKSSGMASMRISSHSAPSQ